jgi:hypothetical protein
LNLRSYEPWFALGGLLVLRPKRGVPAPASAGARPAGRKGLAGAEARAPRPDNAWLTATLTFGSPFDTLPPGLGEHTPRRLP